MDLMTKNALLLGHYKAMLEYAIDGLKGNTAQQGTQLAEYLEDRIKKVNEEINQNTNTNEHRNNS
jgi:hypothetical protein